MERTVRSQFGCSRSNADKRTSCPPRSSEARRQPKHLPRNEKHQDYSVRRLPGPAIRPLCEGVQTPEAHHELFRDWQRTQTQSSATAPWEPEAANRCLVLLESRDLRPRGHRCAMAHPDLINARSPERANGHLCFSLDLDLHRCGLPFRYC